MNSPQVIRLFGIVCLLWLTPFSFSQEQTQSSPINDEQCEKIAIEKISEQRKANFQKLEIGSKLPDIQLSLLKGETIFLSKIDFEYVMLIFWGSECDICEMIMPQFIDLYSTYDSLGFEMVGISMDVNLDAWNKTIEENGYPWKNHCDALGWQGPIADEYNIYGTPTILLLNKELEIAGFPKSINEIKDFLQQNLTNNQLKSEE